MPNEPMSQKLLILDLDETLIFATDKPLARTPDFVAASYHVYRRPFLTEFLTTIQKWYDLAVWTSASGTYAASILQVIKPAELSLSFIWSERRCTRCYDHEFQDYYFVKDLRKVKRLGYKLEQVLMLDDSPEKVQRNYGNHVPVKPFSGDMEDTELRDILPFLKHLCDVENVRRIEKRKWRERMWS